MENVSHSYAKKSYHHHGSNGGFIKATASSKSLYDDVFGGPPKFGVPTLAPRYEDYTEIFGGFHSSRASSIPVLDLPVVDDADDHFSFDVQSSHFDYSEIFGGFQVFDFGLCYEDLVGQSTSASGYDSSDEAWSPAQSETLSDESDPSAFSERSRSSSGADVHHSSDDTKQFNISYHKSFQRTGGGGSNGTTHVTRLHAIPGYTCTVSGSLASRSTEDEESPRQTATLDHNHNVDLSGTVLEDKRSKRTSHNMSNSFIMHETDSKLPEKCNEASCTPQKPFVTVSDISLRTRPSGLPPPSRPPPAKKGDFDRLNSRLKASKSSTFERKQGDSSQPYFDVEEYASSSAAASTAAIKDAMEKAQAKLRSAKELMERKKQDLKSYTKLHLENGILEERPSKAFDKEDKAQSMCVENMEEVFNNSEVISGNIQDGKHFQFNRKSEESEQGKPNMSSQQPYKAEGEVAWREGAEFFEVVETYPSCRSPEKVKNESGLLHNIEPHEYKQFEAASESLDHLKTCKNVVAKEAPECNQESEEKVNKVSYQWGNMYQSSKGEDLCSQLEHKETVTVEENLFDFNTTERHVKAEKIFFDTEAEHFDIKLMAESEVEDCEEGLKDVVFEARSGQRVNEIPKQEGEKQSDVVSEREEGGIHQEENAKRSKEYFKSEKDDENSEVDFTMDPKVQDVKGAFELEQEDIHFKVAHKKEHGRDEAEGRPNGACEGEDSDLEMMEVLEQQEDKTKSPVASGVEFDNISEEASVLEETEQTMSCDDKLEDLREQTDRLETELQSCERKSEVGMTNLLPEDCCTNVCKREDVMEHGKDQIKRADTIGSTSLNGHSTNSSGADMCIGKSSGRLKKTASETANHSGHVDGNYTECLTVNTKGVQSGTNQKTTGEMFTAGYSDHRNGTDPVGPRANAKVGQSGTYQEVMEERAANAKKIGDALAAVLEDVEILSSTDQTAATASAQKNQRNPNKVVTPDAQKMDERLEKDRKLQEEYLRKLEEEREREREREKDRMSVTREALERSYLETRERVERATAEIRQRAMAEARERSSAEQEARLRAERAAVERATAEARQRAFEKAMAEKAIQESRERMERSSSENFSAYSRSSEMRQSSSSEQHELQSTEASKLRYSYSSAHAGIEGESPQRCKARLERYRRTSERAAKALAEKNMRDLLAQREQAERNRLAENLDAEVKRWSSGKEGNLRALLSTLQYILGPNSGWQPIPLTEVITSAAVKKAYRKATLCVHPDKLQQRGATIQQKYICEKVFDLLKEAWNRFNSEER